MNKDRGLASMEHRKAIQVAEAEGDYALDLVRRQIADADRRKIDRDVANAANRRSVQRVPLPILRPGDLAPIAKDL